MYKLNVIKSLQILLTFSAVFLVGASIQLIKGMPKLGTLVSDRASIEKLLDEGAQIRECQAGQDSMLLSTNRLVGYGVSTVDVGLWVREADGWRLLLVSRLKGVADPHVLFDKDQQQIRLSGDLNNELNGKDVLVINIATFKP